MILNLTLLVVVILFQTINSITCDEEESCAGMNLTDSDSNHIYCEAYSSCHSSPLIQISSNPDGVIACLGSKSCYNTSIIQRISNPNSQPIHCYGMASCASVSLINNQNGSINCHGQYSCSNSMITMHYGTITCGGSHSCANSSIFVARDTKINIFGYMSAQNTTFYSTGTQPLFNFYDSISSENGPATIICGDYHECIISCYGSGCDNVIAVCNSSLPCYINTRCDNSRKNDICPTNYQYQLLTTSIQVLENVTLLAKQYLDTALSLSVNEMMDYNYYSDLCSVSCNDVYACEGGIWESSFDGNGSSLVDLNNYDGGLICCNGKSSCSLANNISTWNVSVSLKLELELESVLEAEFLDLQAAIFCDSYYACDRITDSIIAKKRGNIYVRGRSGFGTSSYDFKIKTSNDNSIFCMAAYACTYQTLAGSGNVFCGGTRACSNSIVIENVNNVWSVASSGATLSTMVNIKNNIYCVATGACRYSTIENVTGTVFGLHGFAVESSTLINITQVICDGLHACQKSTFEHVRKIVANSKNSLAGMC